MKKFSSSFFAIVFGSILPISSALAQKSDSSAGAGASKMTKEQAQNLVTKKYPGARVSGAEQKTVNGKSVWVVRFMQTGGNTAQQVQVDEAGKLTRM
jgi:hypothetical protein